jgi:hypothetical protein
VAKFWRADKTYRDYARMVATLKRRAEKRGDRDAAMFLLQDFVNHADELDSVEIPHFQRITIRFVVRAVREFLEGKNIKAAFCLDSEGRPSMPLERDLSVALYVGHLYKKLRLRADNQGGKPLVWAVNAVADEIRKYREKSGKGKGRAPKAMVAAAVKRFGGIKRVVRMVDECGYDAGVAKAMQDDLVQLKKKSKPRVKQTA